MTRLEKKNMYILKKQMILTYYFKNARVYHLQCVNRISSKNHIKIKIK
jgi:hypothetical protein